MKGIGHRWRREGMDLGGQTAKTVTRCDDCYTQYPKHSTLPHATHRLGVEVLVELFCGTSGCTLGERKRHNKHRVEAGPLRPACVEGRLDYNIGVTMVEVE